MTHYNPFPRLILSIIAIAFGTTTTVAQEQLTRLPSETIAIDEDILAVFVDEPCRHFEAARDLFSTGQLLPAADHLRTASVFLRLEGARATPEGKAGIDAAVDDLQRLALAIQNNQVQSPNVLDQAFARAHYALASHHCIKSSHRCCRVATFENQEERTRAGHDLNAATVHLERGLRWAGEDMDEKTRNSLKASRLAAGQLINQAGGSQTNVQRVIHGLHRKLEGLTGRKIMLAQPSTGEDKLGPPLFR